MLLSEHVLGAAAAGDPTALALARATWAANADQIATFLVTINARWRFEDLQSMMRAHLERVSSKRVARHARRQ